MQRKALGVFSFDGKVVATSDVTTLLWVMKEAGHVPDPGPEEPMWRVVLGFDRVFAVTDKETATAIRQALRNAGIQTSVSLEPDTTV